MPEKSVPAKRRVLLIFGGRSAEHDVSRVTAVAVARALDPERYDVVPIAITTDGQWLLADSARAALDAGAAALPDAFMVDGAPAAGLGELVAQPGSTPAASPTAPGSAPGSRGELDVDVVFPLLHGPYGEDGTVQGLLELADLPYVGSGVVGSAVAMDKVMMKRAFAACGLATPRHLVFRDGGEIDAFLDAVGAELGYPCFAKPANLGSSVGVSKAVDRGSLAAACSVALDFDEWILVEEAIHGREIEVAVLGDEPPEASVPGEIVPGAEFYTYADKYEHDDAQLLAPAPLTDAQALEAQALAVAAFEACRCEAMARVDLFFEEIGPGGAPGRGFLVNEVNTIPGFTPISMYPRLWEVSGLSYSALLDRLIELAIDRHDRKARRAGRQRES
jgi:D-alanine-D-alanine ligase